MRSGPVFKKLLIPVDDSVPSLNAQELAASIAKLFNSKVTVLYVVSHEFMIPEVASLVAEIETQGFAPGQIARGEYSMPRQIPFSSGTTLKKGMLREINNSYHQRADGIVAEAKRLFNEEGIAADHVIIEHQDAADTIISQAEEGNYDLIIMGRSGEKEERPHLGSIAEKVSRHADVPVLITGEKRKVSTMLVAFDGSEDAEKALSYAEALAKKTPAKMTLLYVQEPGFLKLKPETVKQIGARILSKATAKIKGTEFDQRIESGDPSKIISQIAEKENYDLIVMGSKGQGGIKRFLLGSVSEHVLHYSNHAMLIVK